MRIGIDFDNTLVDYDRLFHKVACEWKAIDEQTPATKLAVRNALRDAGQEQRWTEMQGYVYGARMDEAAPYPGALEFLRRANEAGHVIAIISHKTLHPFAGPAYDLHAAARAWIERHVVHEGKPLVPQERVFFELTKEAKLARIAAFGCELFIDDLPELLLAESFPQSVTTRVLFDPDRRHGSPPSAAISLLNGWSEASRYLASDDVTPAIASLLAKAGISGEPRMITLLRGSGNGGNNRVHRVETDHGTFIAKQYFRDERDTRDRLAAEYAFLTHAANVAPGATPRPYACDADRGFALYEFIDGRPLAPGAIGMHHVEQAVAFFVALNREPATLGNAAESCFSIREHLDLVDGRIRRLAEAGSPEARTFVQDLASRWTDVASKVLDGARALRLDPDAQLSSEQRCLSPSDFGFHNALVESDGRIRFLDFEYAGIDDPAKMTGDFFSQLAVPVPQKLFTEFVERTMSIFPRAEELVRRAQLLRPVYRIKWCCIALNVFLPVHLARRKFADPSLHEASVKAAQLAKAEHLLRTIPEAGVVD